MIALVVLLVIGLLAGLGGIVGGVLVWREVDDAVDEATDGGGIPGLIGGECAQFQMAYLSMGFTGLLGAGIGDAEREQVEAQLGELEELAPDEIRGDLEIVADAMREAIALGTGGGGLVGGGEPSDEQVREAEAILERPEVVEAQANIDQWVERNCS
jgi:hypothetical protein